MWAMDVLIVELYASEVGWYCIALVVVLFRSDGVLRLCKRRGRGRGEEEEDVEKKRRDQSLFGRYLLECLFT
jgi:hypothetical protein